MRDNFLTLDESWVKRDAILRKDTKEYINDERILKKMERSWTDNQKETVEIPGTNNEKSGLGEFSTHMTYGRQEKQD